MATDARRLIRQEIEARTQFINGTILSDPELKTFDGSGSGSPTWVADLDISSNRPVADVPVRAVNGSYSYARKNAAVLVKLTAGGQIEIVGPGERLTGTSVIKEYHFGVTTAVSSENEGFTSRIEPFEYYQGGGPGASLWNDGVTPFPKTTILDGDGNPVVL